MFGNTLLRKIARMVRWQSAVFVNRYTSVTDLSMELALYEVICNIVALVVCSQTMRSEGNYLYKMIIDSMRKIVVELLLR
jgi:hypothetical protein